MFKIEVQSKNQEEIIDITPQIARLVSEHGADAKACLVYIPHTTAALTINENADPDVKKDMLKGLRLLVPPNTQFKHSEGNSDAHIKASLLGCFQIIPVEKGYLKLGTWQGILLAEFDGPRTRQVWVQLI
ncbi:secondary thiamine-phosphate synthase enzyme [Thermosyntropha lipolytica DSM 11003]|uniref:Secondary thiamine-phosphate synthase enzyme n=1 Tax=Thermosyntropha lipolytica DSM 11003 TaxID=1123382 RepID=A0A1M5PEQ5_9FIRM|nr:secondary thiamine-phosphate synthase enzyme YjbQ [Thermosyntropha lipolytica]SHH00198.1 secondary thiamine-phosphate synthase enzyme [Thermosyntropha lipolytica DSM 11003]